MTNAEQQTSTNEMICDRLTIAKEASGMGVKALSDASGVYIGDVRHYLRGTKVPDFGDLWALAKVMDVPYAYFDRPLSEVELVSYRKHSKVTKQQELRAKIAIQIGFGNYHDVEDLLELQPHDYLQECRVKSLPSNEEEVEDIASSLRAKLGIDPQDCQPDVHAALDKRIKLLPFESENDNHYMRLDGCVVKSSRGDRAIAFNTNAPIDRQRFTLAHELGHMVLDSEFDERTANNVAAAFLMPNHLVAEGFKSGTLTDLLDLKERFGCSVAALNRRCFRLGLISEDEYERSCMQMLYREWDKLEPQVPLREPVYRRYANHCFDARRRGLVTMSRLAELLDTSIEDVRPFR